MSLSRAMWISDNLLEGEPEAGWMPPPAPEPAKRARLLDVDWRRYIERELLRERELLTSSVGAAIATHGDETLDQVEALIAQAHAEIDTKIESLRAEHRAELDVLRAEHQAELNQLRVEHHARIEQLRTEHRAAIDQIRADHHRSLTAVRNRWTAISKEVHAVRDAASEKDARAKKANGEIAHLLLPMNGGTQ